MKKLILNSILVISLCFSAFSQSIENTTWYVYNSSNILTYKFHFSTDTIFISTNLSSYYPLSNYYENGSTLTLYDITGAVMACPATDTGSYSFVVQNDTLLFTMLSEPCAPRAVVLTSYHWLRAETLLHNTFWNVYDLSNVLTYKFHYGADIGYMSTNLSTYYPLSNFFENGNEFTLYDIAGAFMACPTADTGHYTFAIQNDTLLFTVVTDPCAPRVGVLTTYHWVRNITSNVEGQELSKSVLIFPNPSPDGVFNLIINEMGFYKYSVSTIHGKHILETIISRQENIVNLTNFQTGVYLLTVYGKQGNKVFKLVR